MNWLKKQKEKLINVWSDVCWFWTEFKKLERWRKIVFVVLVLFILTMFVVACYLLVLLLSEVLAQTALEKALSFTFLVLILSLVVWGLSSNERYRDIVLEKSLVPTGVGVTILLVVLFVGAETFDKNGGQFMLGLLITYTFVRPWEGFFTLIGKCIDDKRHQMKN